MVLIVNMKQSSDLDSKLGSIQVASLTIITEDIAAAGQEVRISNSAYTIVTNFDNALAVTVPIYCWGEYVITCENMDRRKAIITADTYEYLVTFGAKTIYSYGYDPYNMTETYSRNNTSFTKKTDRMYFTCYGRDSESYGYMTVLTDIKIDLTQYNTLEVTYGNCANEGKFGAMWTETMITGFNYSLIKGSVTDSNTTVIIDISNVNGEYFVGMGAWSAGRAVTGEVFEIILR